MFRRSMKLSWILVGNYAGMVYTLGLVIGLWYLDCFILCPEYYATTSDETTPATLIVGVGGDKCEFTFWFGSFIVAQVLLNFALFHYATRYNKVQSLLGRNRSIYDASSGDKNQVFTLDHNWMTSVTSTSASSGPPNYNSMADQRYPPYENLVNRSPSNPNLSDNNNGDPQQQLYPQPPRPVYYEIKKYTKFCEKCQIPSPLRSFHCPACGYCVLKKDHHCFMTGACVGYGNQRYFIVSLFWLQAGSIYGLSYLFRYLDKFFVPVLSWYGVEYFGPVAFVKWALVGSISHWHFFLIMFLNAMLTAGIAAFVFFLVQWIFIVRNRTMWEIFKRLSVTDNQTTFMERVRIIFGPYCLINFLFPTPFKNKLDPSFRLFLEENDLKIV